MKKSLFAMMTAALVLLTGCSAASSAPTGSGATSVAASTSVTAPAKEEVSTKTGVTITTPSLSDDENQLLSLVGANALLFDYSGSKDSVSIVVTSYQLKNGKLEELNTVQVPGGASGRIAVSFNKMVEGFRAAVQNSGGVNNLEISADETFPNGTACVSWMAGFNGADYAYGQEIPIVSQVATKQDTAENIAAEDLLNHPEQFAENDYEGVYLMTLTIDPTT